jgi:hypothetical protein
MAKLKIKLRKGQHVVLAEFHNGDNVEPEQCGWVDGVDRASGTAIVTLCEQHVHGNDDGLREVPLEQLTPSKRRVEARKVH